MKYCNLLIALMLFGLTSCVQKTKTQVVRFEVQAPDATWSMGVRGSMSPLNWGEDFSLKDLDSNGIYSGELTFEIPYDYVELKLVRNGGEFELDGQPNRKLYFDESGETDFSVSFDQPAQ